MHRRSLIVAGAAIATLTGGLTMSETADGPDRSSIRRTRSTWT